MADLRDCLRHSVIPAVPVPFGPDESIDFAALRSYARWMAGQRVGAVAVWAHTGRGLCLTDSQRSDVLAVWRDELGDSPIICGVGVPDSSQLPVDQSAATSRVIGLTQEMARAAKHGGADGVMVYPPTPLRGFDDVGARVVEVHQAVAEVGIPVIAFYLYEAAGGISYSRETIEELVELEAVIGMKLATLDSVMTFQVTAAVVKQQENALLITGEDRFLGYSLMLGADAALIGIAAACTDRSVALLDSWYDTDLASFVRQSAALDGFAQSTFREPMDGYVQRMLWALEAEGVLPNSVRDQFGPFLEPSERDAVHRAVRAFRSE